MFVGFILIGEKNRCVGYYQKWGIDVSSILFSFIEYYSLMSLALIWYAIL